ncbi:hypothetical protein [Dietzia aurantiaca]|uniref:hypothetical protein n=1 Tax=Dietzia aurantiaca TaxID=983873 RepID=UPI001E4A77F8|nr:hypothetical protein [Dietzia aurantiaca]
MTSLMCAPEPRPASVRWPNAGLRVGYDTCCPGSSMRTRLSAPGESVPMVKRPSPNNSLAPGPIGESCTLSGSGIAVPISTTS